MKIKKKYITKISIFIAFILSINICVPITNFVFAKSKVENSIGSINYEDDGITIGFDKTQKKQTTYIDKNTIDNGETSEVDVYVSQASTFRVFIPKTIILDGKVNENVVNGEFSNVGMIAGNWRGLFNFNIGLVDTNYVDYENTSFNDLTWKQIQTLAINNEFLDYYEIGKIKTFEYEGDVYSAEVIGVNTYNDGEITFMTKELLPTKYAMNEVENDIGSWPQCNLRTILNNTIYDSLPNDLKNVITPKTLTYEIHNGSVNNIGIDIATDKLWLPT